MINTVLCHCLLSNNVSKIVNLANLFIDNKLYACAQHNTKIDPWHKTWQTLT